MNISLYDVSVGTYLQILPALNKVLKKGGSHCESGELNCNDLLDIQLHPDMFPLRFQIISVMHHSLGAIKGIQQGVFRPPTPMPDVNYEGFFEKIDETIAELKAFTPESINELMGKKMIFKMGELELPFSAENFIMTFSLPNFYFHATTAYDILRLKGVKLGKADFLGHMRIG